MSQVYPNGAAYNQYSRYTKISIDREVKKSIRLKTTEDEPDFYGSSNWFRALDRSLSIEILQLSWQRRERKRNVWWSFQINISPSSDLCSRLTKFLDAQVQKPMFLITGQGYVT